jgi:hypothetical protein
MRIDGKRVTLGPEATIPDNEAADRKNAARMYEDVAVIEGRSQLFESVPEMESTDILKDLTPPNAGRVDDDLFVTANPGSNHIVGFGFGDYAAQVADVRPDNIIRTYSFEAASNYNNPASDFTPTRFLHICLSR